MHVRVQTGGQILAFSDRPRADRPYGGSPGLFIDSYGQKVEYLSKLVLRIGNEILISHRVNPGAACAPDRRDLP